MNDSIEVVDRLPTLEEYLELTSAVGWSSYVTAETAKVALAHSLFAVVAERDGRAVAMARIVGDGALFFYVQDVAVLPNCQGTGLGAAVMDRSMAWLDSNAPDRAFVGLFSAAGKARFYTRYGFTAATADRPGMSRYIRPE
ncbi:MAG: GNAT family N-acetyltransferase [Myxococcales bacterium]|nr:GNAT family N-acetyltransferase [Myxococcales bacterium]